MFQTLPYLFAAGQFDSRSKYTGLNHSPLRAVETYEVEYYFEEGALAVVNGVRYPMQKNTVLIARPGDHRQSRLPFKCLYLHFGKVNGLAAELLERLPTVINADLEGKVRNSFLRIEQLFLSAEVADELAAVGELLLLLGLLEQCCRSGSPAESGSTVEQARQYINAHYAEELSVEVLAAQCNVSTSYLHKLFAEKLGQSPHEVLVNCRIAAAKGLLMNSDRPLSEIAVSCGFNSQAYFSDCFKRRTGMSPGQFRRNAEHLG